jgi:hypothetical protein
MKKQKHKVRYILGYNVMSLLYLLSAVALAFFKAVTELAWGLASMFLLAGLITYFKVDTSTIQPLLFKMFAFIVTNIKWFLLAIFVFYMFRNIKEMKE